MRSRPHPQKPNPKQFLTTSSPKSHANPFEGSTGDESYFVSNYPPYPRWSANAVSSIEDQLRATTETDRPLGVYVHVPFCRKRCHFCYFKVYTGQNAKQVDAYLDGVIEEAKLVTQMGGWANRDPHFLYFGGGTPSFLSARQFDRLYNALSKTLSFTSLREFTFECEPGTISLDKVKALHSAGVDRISLGVEHFDDAILALNGRAHDQASIYDAYRYARDAKVPQINIDLIAGLLGDREQTWLDAVNRTIELAPDSVTIYQMELPYNTSFQDDIRRAEQSAAEQSRHHTGGGDPWRELTAWYRGTPIPFQMIQFFG